MSAIVVLLLVLVAWMQWRSWAIYRFLQARLDETSAAAKADIWAGRDWEWRYSEYRRRHADEQNRIWWQVWRPLRPWMADDSYVRRAT